MRADLTDRSINRADIVAEAHQWIGTPYCHQACRRDAGVDCLGLIIGVWDAAGGEPFALSRTDRKSWALHADGEPLLDGLREHLMEITDKEPLPGDVLALRWRSLWPASHLAFFAGDGAIIHAYEGGRVVKTKLAPWRRHVAAIFSFPHIID